MLYTLFIDETGDHTMHRCNEFSQRFLCLTGILISRKHEKDVVMPELEALKEKYIGDSNYALHRSDMIKAINGFEPLAVEAVRDAFDHDLLQALSRWKFKVWSVCIDKKAHLNRLGMWRHPPYHYCLEVLAEKVATYLAKFDHRSDVVVEARYKKVDRQLKSCYRDLYIKGTNYVDASRYKEVFTNGELKLKPKTSNFSGLQLADIIAYPSKLEILRDNNIVDDLGNPVSLTSFSVEICKVIGPKYDQWRGSVYGKKLLV